MQFEHEYAKKNRIGLQPDYLHSRAVKSHNLLVVNSASPAFARLYFCRIIKNDRYRSHYHLRCRSYGPYSSNPSRLLAKKGFTSDAPCTGITYAPAVSTTSTAATLLPLCSSLCLRAGN